MISSSSVSSSSLSRRSSMNLFSFTMVAPVYIVLWFTIITQQTHKTTTFAFIHPSPFGASRYDYDSSDIIRYAKSKNTNNQENEAVVFNPFEQPPQQNRKKKKNKYAKFSKTDQQTLDPMEALMEESKAKNEEIQKTQKSKQKKSSVNPQRLTSAEQNDSSSNHNDAVYNSTKMYFPDTRQIDPYDPTTYGFTELGTIMGPHGVKGDMKLLSTTSFATERLCTAGIRHLKMPSRRSPREVRLKAGGRHQMDQVYLIGLVGVEDRDAARKLRGAVLYAKETERPKDLEEDEFMISDLVGLEVFLEEGYEEQEMEFDLDDFEYDGEDEEEEFYDYDENNEEEYEEQDFEEEEFPETNDVDTPKEGKKLDLGGTFVGKVSGIVLAEDICSISGIGNDLLEITLPRGLGGLPSWKDELVLVPFVPQLVPRVDLNAKEIYIDPPPGLLDLTYYKQDNVRIKGFLPPARDD